eukprot:363501-Chlamydomonas_euryale.AAC.5
MRDAHLQRFTPPAFRFIPRAHATCTALHYARRRMPVHATCAMHHARLRMPVHATCIALHHARLRMAVHATCAMHCPASCTSLHACPCGMRQACSATCTSSHACPCGMLHARLCMPTNQLAPVIPHSHARTNVLSPCATSDAL